MNILRRSLEEYNPPLGFYSEEWDQPSQPPVPPSNPPSGPAPLYINIIVKEEKKEEEDLIMASVSYLLLLNSLIKKWISTFNTLYVDLNFQNTWT